MPRDSIGKDKDLPIELFKLCRCYPDQGDKERLIGQRKHHQKLSGVSNRAAKSAGGVVSLLMSLYQYHCHEVHEKLRTSSLSGGKCRPPPSNFYTMTDHKL